MQRLGIFVMVLALGLCMQPGGVYGARVLYDDFSGERLDVAKWGLPELSRRVDANASVLVSNIGFGEGDKNRGAFVDPESITEIRTTVTLKRLDKFTSEYIKMGAGAEGIFYNAATSGMTNDVWAGVVVGDRGDGPEAWWEIRESLDDDFEDYFIQSTGALVAHDDSPGIQLNTPYNVILEYLGGSAFNFIAAGESQQGTGSVRARDPQNPYRAISTGGESDGPELMNGYISAEFDDVFLNKSTSPYETFGIAPLSAGKWRSLERVRAPANGTLRLVVQADGERMSSGVSAAASNTAFLEAKVKVRDESTVSAGAQASARIGGWYYNATPNIGDTQDYDGRQGDVWVQNEIVLDENDNLRARVRVLRSNDSDSNSLSQIFVQNFLKAVAFGEFHTLSIERGGGVFTFKCDDEVIRYSVFGPFFPPSEPTRELQSQVFAGSGQSGVMRAEFDDVTIDQ